MIILAVINKGKILDKQWYGNDYRYEFQFETGEKFFRSAKDMNRGGWPMNKERYLKKYAKLTRD